MKVLKILTFIFLTVALVGIFFPSLHFSISFMGSEHLFSISVFDVFQAMAEPSGIPDITNSFDFMGIDNPLANIGRSIIVPAILYALALIFVLASLIFTNFKKTNNFGLIFSILSVVLATLASFQFTNLPQILADGLTQIDGLGFISAFIDIASIFKVRLGIGYWLLIGGNICAILTMALQFRKK